MAPKTKHIRDRLPTFLKEWRKHRGLTQERAADRLGITQSTLSKIENGVHPYDQDFLEAAALAYNCQPADLLMRNPLIPDSVWTLSDNLKRAPADVQEQARVVVEALLRRAS
jgi:transcriptional regulator with XRE-family HTH domain